VILLCPDMDSSQSCLAVTVTVYITKTEGVSITTTTPNTSCSQLLYAAKGSELTVFRCSVDIWFYHKFLTV